MKVGDLLLIKSGTHVPPGTRYSSGIILEVREDPQITKWNGIPEIYLDVLWIDGHRSTEEHGKFLPYYDIFQI